MIHGGLFFKVTIVMALVRVRNGVSLACVSRVQRKTRSKAMVCHTSSVATTAAPLSNLRVQQNVKAGAAKRRTWLTIQALVLFIMSVMLEWKRFVHCDEPRCN